MKWFTIWLFVWMVFFSIVNKVKAGALNYKTYSIRRKIDSLLEMDAEIYCNLGSETDVLYARCFLLDGHCNPNHKIGILGVSPEFHTMGFAKQSPFPRKSVIP